ncbi:MAG: ribonuclease III, partial [Geminicoccaceae bacterium]|nr:ribonuclease III [Geminicoccaceae bacterium]
TRQIEDNLGYRFSEPSLLLTALTHVSAIKPAALRTSSYQRLEFLGDHVLGLVVSDMLYRAFPNAEEGELSKRLADLVRRETCAAVGGELGLSDAIQTGPGGGATTSRLRASVLADVCEAVIGAVFVDGGYDAAAELVRRYWEGRVAGLTSSPRDAKTMLQVWALARARELPSYTVLDSEGPAHAPVFTVEASLGGLGAATAEAGSKRAAEQAAAALLLERLERGADDA